MLHRLAIETEKRELIRKFVPITVAEPADAAVAACSTALISSADGFCKGSVSRRKMNSGKGTPSLSLNAPKLVKTSRESFSSLWDTSIGLAKFRAILSSVFVIEVTFQLVRFSLTCSA